MALQTTYGCCTIEGTHNVSINVSIYANLTFEIDTSNHSAITITDNNGKYLYNSKYSSNTNNQQANFKVIKRNEILYVSFAGEYFVNHGGYKIKFDNFKSPPFAFCFKVVSSSECPRRDLWYRLVSKNDIHNLKPSVECSTAFTTTGTIPGNDTFLLRANKKILVLVIITVTLYSYLSWW
jgi:hypothetical protein